MNDVNEAGIHIRTELINDVTLAGMLGVSVESGAPPAVFVTPLVPEKEVNYPQVNIYDTSAYNFFQPIKSLLYTAMFRDKNDDQDFTKAQGAAVRGCEVLNREFQTDSGKRYYFRCTILPVIAENNKIFAIPVEVRITKIN